MQSKIVWGTRYSQTEESDKFGRWARIMYLNSVPFAWVKKVEIENQSNSTRYSASLYFPTLQNDSATDHKLCLTFEEAKEFCETEFEKFVKVIKAI